MLFRERAFSGAGNSHQHHKRKLGDRQFHSLLYSLVGKANWPTRRPLDVSSSQPAEPKSRVPLRQKASTVEEPSGNFLMIAPVSASKTQRVFMPPFSKGHSIA